MYIFFLYFCYIIGIKWIKWLYKDINFILLLKQAGVLLMNNLIQCEGKGKKYLMKKGGVGGKEKTYWRKGSKGKPYLMQGAMEIFIKKIGEQYITTL